MVRLFVCGWICLAAAVCWAEGDGWAAVEKRMEDDVAAGKPLVVHVIVALCDNENQGIIRVPAHLGNGQDLKGNLYWGAAYGVRTFLTRKGGWEVVAEPGERPAGMLDNIVLRRKARLGGTEAEVYMVAEAWDGREMRWALTRFMHFCAGKLAQRPAEEAASGCHAPPPPPPPREEVFEVKADGQTKRIAAGPDAHLVAFAGHNGFMDFPAFSVAGAEGAGARCAMVLACKTKMYFAKPLAESGAYPLLLTTNFMAPEAYTLDAAVKAWAGGGEPASVELAAARAYDEYQKCGLKGAKRLFTSGGAD